VRQVRARREIETADPAGTPALGIDDAIADLEEAWAKLTETPTKDKRLRRAARQIRKARKKLAGSLKKLLKGRSAGSVTKLIDRAAKKEMKALEALGT
jgi:hypothetical protein